MTIRKTKALQINAERLLADFTALAEIGATVSGGVSRLALSNEDLEARAWFASRLDEANLMIGDDDAGNLSGILFSTHPQAKRSLIIGAHMDSVPNAGRYDSSVGIIAGLECLRTIKESGITLPVHLELIDFTDEEGCWHSLFGSRSLTGKLESSIFSESSDGRTDYGAFRAALVRAGIRPNEVYKAARDPNKVAGFLELHVEQGGRLYEHKRRIGIVTGIVGRSTYEISFVGEAGHSGTTAYQDRKDALLGASDFIHRAHKWVHEVSEQAVFNCGYIDVKPGAFNVIPRLARLTIECRHPDEDVLSRIETGLLELAETCAKEHRLTVKSKIHIHMPAAEMSPHMIHCIEDATRRLHIEDVLHMISYAGHDAQMFSSITPTGMIFIPSVNGISHNPKEFTEWEDIVTGANVLLHSIINFANGCQ